MFLDNIVIGSTIESILYAFLNDYYFISTRRDFPMFYRNLSIPVLGYETEPEAWNRLNFMMGLLGRRSSFDNFDNFKIENNKIKVSESGHLCHYEFNNCFIFDPTNIKHENLELDAKGSTYLVLDDFELSRLGNKNSSLPRLKTDDNFVNQINFYTSDRIDGCSFISDCVAESFLTKEQLYDFDYSDTMVKFIIERYLTSIGIRGHFMNFYKNGNPKYRKPIVKHVKRLIFERDNNVYQDSDNVKFISMTLKDIFNEASTKG